MSRGLFEMFILKNENKSNNGPVLVLLINFEYIFCMIVQYVDFIQMVVLDVHEMGQDGSNWVGFVLWSIFQPKFNFFELRNMH